METHPILAPSSYAQKFTRFIFEKEEKKNSPFDARLESHCANE